MKKYRVHALLGPFFKLIEALFELFVPLVVADIIDVGIESGDKGYIISRGLLMAGLGLIGFICAVTAQYFAAKASVGFASSLRHAVFNKIQDFKFTDIDNVGTSTLITRLTGDINQIQTGVNLALRLLLRSPFIVFGAMIMAFTVDVKTALIFAASIPVLGVIVVVIMTVTVPLYKSVQKKLDGVLKKTRETLLGVRVIRAFCKEDDEKAEFSAQNDSQTKAQKFVGKISSLMNPLTYVVVNAAVIAIIWVGGRRVYNGDLTTGQVVALYNYMSQILVELIKLANMIITLNRSIASASRVESVINSEISMECSADDTEPSKGAFVEFKNVSFKYAGAGADSLDGINMCVKKGETIGIIGPTGSGKTTLVNLIPHFYGTTSGTVFIDGRDVKTIPDKELRRKVGTVLQKAVLFKGTIRDNLLLGGKNADDKALLTALDNAQALAVVESKGGLDAPVEQGGRNFSGGQKQRIAIARTLVGDPEILILDDSSSALDFATEAALRKAIASLPYRPTVFTVSQRVSTVMHADRILVLEDGKAVGLGTHDELLLSCPLYAEICRSQLEKEGA